MTRLDFNAWQARARITAIFPGAVIRPNEEEEHSVSDWKPSAYPSMSPYLIARDGEALIDFLMAAFDARLLRRFNHEDGTLMHAEVKIDDSVVMVGGGVEHPGASAHIHLYVQDVEATFARALDAGATVVQDPVRKSADDDLRGGVQDPSGTTWWIATQ